MGQTFDFEVTRLTDEEIRRQLAELDQEFGMSSAEFLHVKR